MLSRTTSKPAGRQAPDVLPGLRLGPAHLRLPISLLVAALSGALLSLAFPPADLGPLALVAVAPALWVVRGAPRGQAAAAGGVFGLVFFGLHLSWLHTPTALGYGALVIGQAAFVAVLLAYVATVWRDDRPVRTALAVGAAWVAVEWLREVTPIVGFTWGGLGYTQHDNPLLLPLASVAGAWGISAAVAAVNALVVLAVVRARSGWRGVRGLALAGVLLAAAPGAIPLSTAAGTAADVAIVQGNVPPRVAGASRIIEDHIVARNHARLHRRLAADPPDLAVWPENALDQDPERDPVIGPVVVEALREVGAHALVGTIAGTPDTRLRNENVLYDPDARVLGRYAKQHLVPFGEYVPFRPVFAWIPELEQVPYDMEPGDGPGRLSIPGLRFATAICFENAFPNIVRRATRADDELIVISTNNSTFLRSALAEQHLVMSKLRAVENGRWVVHAALSGISAFVDARGTVHERSDLFRPAVLRRGVPTATGRTLFNRIGGWLPALFVLGAALAFLTPRRPRPRRTEPPPDDPRTAVILPTYNERESIEEALQRLLAVGERVEVIVVDDGSPDGTGDIVRKIAERDPRVRLIERGGKQGLASAYQEGFRRALADGYDLVVEMDADLSHRADELPRLLAGAAHNDLTIGSRYVPGGAITNWGAFRRVLSRGGNMYARVLLGLPVADATSGYRVFRPEVLRWLVARGIRTDGYAFQIELAYRAWRGGFRVGEVPITFQDRETGTSKLSRRIIVEALWHVFRWGVRDRLLRRPAERS